MAVDAGLPHHRLPGASLNALAEGDGGPETLDRLVAAERSRRLLLLRALDDMTSLDPAWDLLARAQRRCPAVVEDVLMYPQTGMWLAYALRRLRGSAHDETPPWVVLGHLSALGAAAGIRAGLDFEMAVPVRHGFVPLPTLGCAVLPGSAPWGTARVRSAGGRTTVELAPDGATAGSGAVTAAVTGAGGAGRAVVELPERPDEDGPGWYGLRRLAVGPAEQRLDVVLDDLDPYRTYPQPTEPARLSEGRAARWQDLLDRAWTVLLRDEPQTAAAMRRGLLSLNPIRAGERFRPRSVTAGDAFGGVVVSEPDDAVQLAATLVHEFQHTKLSGLLHMAPLHDGEPEPADELFYAPWRDDPRPLGGLLQGIYAFMGVTRFWRAHRTAADPDTAATAHFEFAFTRAQVWTVLDAGHRFQHLTPLGRSFLGVVRRRLAGWLEERVPDEQLALAEISIASHRSRWRAHHLQPGGPAVDEAVRAWHRGDARPPAALSAEPGIVPDTAASRLDSVATLVRHDLADRVSLRGEPVKAAADVPGALTADALLAAGDHAGARQAYGDVLAADPGHAAAWAGLGHALAADPARRPAADLLRGHPERARSVQRALLAAGKPPVEPVRLATWLGGGG